MLRRKFANNPMAVVWAATTMLTAIMFAVAMVKKNRALTLIAAVGFFATLAVLFFFYPRRTW
jgi:hypothetical protein